MAHTSSLALVPVLLALFSSASAVYCGEKSTKLDKNGEEVEEIDEEDGKVQR